MSGRRPQRRGGRSLGAPIAVDLRSRRERIEAAVSVLEKHDPAELDRMLALLEGFATLHRTELEAREAFDARLALIWRRPSGGAGEGN